MLTLLVGCAGGAVVFAPTPPPADASPLRYTHPSGAFSVEVPRAWALYEQHTTALAAVAFSPPGSAVAVATFAVVNLGQPIDEAAFAQIIDRYQTEIRPDAAEYSEQNRAAMGDGSWRFTGRRIVASEVGQSINTFLLRSGSLLGVAEVVLPADIAGTAANALQAAVNSFALSQSSSLEPSDLTALTFAKPSALGLLHVAAWTASDGAFFVTGEVGNYGNFTAVDLPVGVELLAADGTVVAGAVDLVLGLGIPPGGFAPFSLRFASRPANAVDYRLTLGGEAWRPLPADVLLPAAALTWTDSSRFDSFGRLVIEGGATNAGREPAPLPRAVVTVFDGAGLVIGAGYVDLPPLAPGESAPFSMVIPETGGDPANYIVNIAALR
jgi:hypothetical protein